MAAPAATSERLINPAELGVSNRGLHQRRVLISVRVNDEIVGETLDLFRSGRDESGSCMGCTSSPRSSSAGRG